MIPLPFSRRTRLISRLSALLLGGLVILGVVWFATGSPNLPVERFRALLSSRNSLPETVPEVQAEPAPAGDEGFYAARTGPNVTEASRNNARDVAVDVVIYGTTTAGIGALRALQHAEEGAGRNLRIALVSAEHLLDSPLAQGLSVEDRYKSGAISGFYKEFRDAVIALYESEGVDPVVDGRLRYEPEVAREALLSFVADQPEVEWFAGELLAASGADGVGPRYLLVKESGGTTVRVNTEYFIDASAEGDLGRLLGASYMIGKTDRVYNDLLGLRPAPPSPENDFVTAPQRFSFLLTLQVHEKQAPSLAGFEHPWYSRSTYSPDYPFGDYYRDGFATSWTMRYVLPNGKRELNETWSDHSSAGASFDWVLHPEKRAELRELMLSRVLDRVRYLQEHGYPQVAVVNVPSRPYVRDGVRFVGLDFYTGEDIDGKVIDHPVAHGVYARYDRHDVALGSSQDSQAAEVFVPIGALLPEKHPYLIVPTAISADESAMCSAVRMEPVRANMGGAAGVMVAFAATNGVSLHQLEYEPVRKELRRQGYQLD